MKAGNKQPDSDNKKPNVKLFDVNYLNNNNVGTSQKPSNKPATTGKQINFIRK